LPATGVLMPRTVFMKSLDRRSSPAETIAGDTQEQCQLGDRGARPRYHSLLTRNRRGRERESGMTADRRGSTLSARYLDAIAVRDPRIGPTPATERSSFPEGGPSTCPPGLMPTIFKSRKQGPTFKPPQPSGHTPSRSAISAPWISGANARKPRAARMSLCGPGVGRQASVAPH
jgi:hypothetical protein